MNKAFIDRFPIILAIDTLSPVKEQKLLIDRTAIEPELAQNLTTIATMARRDYTDNKISTFISTRTLLNIGKLIMQGLTAKEAYITTVLRKTSNKEEQAILKDFFQLVMKISDVPNPDKPIITTQAELDRMTDEINLYRSRLDEYQKLRIEAINAKDEAESKLKPTIDKLSEAQIELAGLQKISAEQAQTILTYKKLDEMIKGIANK